jgi:polyhydroxybutyrate depolymerase
MTMKSIITYLLTIIFVFSFPLLAGGAEVALPGATPATGNSGCGKALAADLGVSKTTLRYVSSGGLERSYLLHVPANYDIASAVPVVLNFHGIQGTPGGQNAVSRLEPTSDREGFILVSPDNNGDFTFRSPLPDIAFVREVIANVSADLCVDAKRIFATGMSRGAFMSTWLGCGAPDLVAAIAPVSGMDEPPAGCGPLPIMEFHGRLDDMVPFLGGNALDGLKFAGAIPVMKSWARANGCSDAPEVEQVSPQVQRVSYQGCKAATIQFIIDDMGHQWPGATINSIGISIPENPANFPTSELIWAFFKAHPKQ